MGGVEEREQVLANPDDVIERARAAKWGYAKLARGRVLCVWVAKDKVVLAEPDGGYFYPMPGEVDSTETPDDQMLAAALTGLAADELEAIRNFCAQPRSMDEIEEEFPDAEAWRLRKLGILKDVGRRKRKIESVWAGWELRTLLDHVFQLQNTGSRNMNNPAPQA